MCGLCNVRRRVILSPRQVIRLLFEIIVPSPHPSVSRRPFFSSSFSSSLPLYTSFRHFPPRSLLPSPTLEPLKWQSFLRRRPVEAKRGERSTGSSLDALRFSYAATSRMSGSTEGTRRMNITGWTSLLCLVMIYYRFLSLCRPFLGSNRVSNDYIINPSNESLTVSVVSSRTYRLFHPWDIYISGDQLVRGVIILNSVINRAIKLDWIIKILITSKKKESWRRVVSVDLFFTETRRRFNLREFYRSFILFEK